MLWHFDTGLHITEQITTKGFIFPNKFNRVRFEARFKMTIYDFDPNYSEHFALAGGQMCAKQILNVSTQPWPTLKQEDLRHCHVSTTSSVTILAEGQVGQ